MATGKVGCAGFCWGGGMSGRLAANSEALGAAVVFYGMPPEADEAANIHVPLLLHYAGRDDAHQRRRAGVRAGAQGGGCAL